MQIFLLLYLIKLLGLSIGLGYLSCSTRKIQGFPQGLECCHLMELWVKYLALFCLSSVTNYFKWFWMGNLHKNTQLMLEFPKTPFLVLLFSYSQGSTITIKLPYVITCMYQIFWPTWLMWVKTESIYQVS